MSLVGGPGRALTLVLALVLCGGGGASATAVAEEPAAKDAGEVTAPGRSLDRALDMVLGRTATAEAGQRAFIIVVDATKNLREAGFHDRLASSLERKRRELAGVPVGLSIAGARGSVSVAPTTDREALLAELAKALDAATTSPVRNLYAEVRSAAGAFPQGATERHVVLVSLDNGDAEDDVEATVRAVQRAKATCSVIAREAFLADSYPLSHSGMVSAPKGTALAAGDGAFQDVPWGWLFQQDIGNEAASSGFAAWGLTRLAAASGGRVHLAAASGGTHQCEALGGCWLCSSDHLPKTQWFEAHRLQVVAPSAASRDDVLAAGLRDPWLRAILDVWAKASKEGLLRSRPTVSPSGSTLKVEERTAGQIPGLTGSSLAFQRLSQQAAKMRTAAVKLLADYEADLAKIEPSQGSQRWRASADYTRVMLHLTIANLELYEGFCAEAGPSICGKADREAVAPEVPRFSEDQKVTGLSYSTDCLCHGLEPFRSRRMAGGAAFTARYDVLKQVLDDYFARYDHTPWGTAVRRSGLAVFVPIVRGKYVPPPPRNGGSTEGDPGTTSGGNRPDRAGGDGGDSGGGGASTGGK